MNSPEKQEKKDNFVIKNLKVIIKLILKINLTGGGYNTKNSEYYNTGTYRYYYTSHY